jgi:Domain of unknown function (DUF6089)
MKYLTILFLMIVNSCLAQQWQAEVMAGVTGYNGDLASKTIDLKTLGPSLSVNIKYQLPNDFVVIRGGISYGKIHANDNNSKNSSTKERNLNFKSAILEGSAAVEINLFDPTVYDGYPYLFAGIGIFHFNPYTNDKNNRKTYLNPLGTEGQGLTQYGNRFAYSLTKVCFPFGLGWKIKINEQFDLAYELGFRYTNSDYLDDVSTTYADPQLLATNRGAIAAELAYRGPLPSAPVGTRRGNPDAKDWYYATGLKLIVKLGEQ